MTKASLASLSNSLASLSNSLSDKVEPELKDYTIVYYEPVGYRAGQVLAYYKQVTTSNLAKLLTNYDIAFVFEGHCKETT